MSKSFSISINARTVSVTFVIVNEPGNECVYYIIAVIVVDGSAAVEWVETHVAAHQVSAFRSRGWPTGFFA